MKRLLIFLLFAALVSVGFAEQRIVVVDVCGSDSPDLHRVERLLSQGWRVLHVSSAGTGGQNSSSRRFLITFVLESPNSPSSNLPSTK